MNLVDVERVHPLHDGTRRHATVDPDSLPHTQFLPARTTPFRQSLPSRVGMIAMRRDFTMPSDVEPFSRVWLSTQLPERKWRAYKQRRTGTLTIGPAGHDLPQRRLLGWMAADHDGKQSTDH